MDRKPEPVIRLEEYRNRDGIAMLKAAIKRLEEGSAFGVIIALDEGLDEDGYAKHGIGATGTYRRNPHQGRAIAGGLFAMFDRLGRKLVRQGKL